MKILTTFANRPYDPEVVELIHALNPQPKMRGEVTHVGDVEGDA